MANIPFTDNLLHRRLRSGSRAFFWVGFVMTLLGVAAILWPAVSTLVATLFVGWMILLFGVLALLGSFQIQGTGPFFGAFLLSLLGVAGGVFLLINPLAGAIGLTLVVAVIFLVQGAAEMLFALDMRPQAGWLPMLFSAIVSIVVALLIVAAWPGISLFLLGILFGLNFVSSGIAYMSIAHALKPAT